MKVKVTTATVFENADSRENPVKTFHIFGVNRGGTTAVASVVRNLGVYLGTDMGDNLEDLCFRFDRGIPDIQKTVDERNADHSIWGWKHPHSQRYLNDIVPSLRNLRLIVVTRDLTANGVGISERSDQDSLEALNMVVQKTRQNLNTVTRLATPTLFVSYEKLLLRPEAVIKEIAQFCNVAVDATRISEIAQDIQPGRYAPPPNDNAITHFVKRVRRRLGV